MDFAIDTDQPPQLRSWIQWALTSFVVAALAACASSGPGRTGDPDGDGDRMDPGSSSKGAEILVRNLSGDSWDLFVGGAPRGSVGPRSDARLLGIRPGPQVVVASNERLGLTQRLSVDAGLKRAAEVRLEPMVATLRVSNPHDEAVEVAVEGATLGTVSGRAEAVFQRVPAGRRILVLKSTRGPGAVRVDKTMPPDAEARLTIPDIDAPEVDPNAPRPPAGQGLVRMKNASRLQVTLYADGRAYGTVAPGAVYDLVLPPGNHTLEVRVDGIDARTQHTVTLIPNQVAEWVWGHNRVSP